jgi:hypothetical protein
MDSEAQLSRERHNFAEWITRRRSVYEAGRILAGGAGTTKRSLVMIRSIAIATLLLATTAAFAQDISSQHRGGAAEQKACKNDAAKYCRAVLSAGDEPVYQCLREERARISAACRKVIDSNKF